MTNKKEEFERNLLTGFNWMSEKCLKDIKNIEYEITNLNDFEDGSNPYEYGYVFLKGACHLFALALKEKYGYLGLNLQTEKNTNAHYFCQVNYKGKAIYVDVRGMTMNLNDVISEFVSGEEYKIVPYDFVNEKVLSKAEEHGYKFAKQIIENYPEFYDVNKLRE